MDAIPGIPRVAPMSLGRPSCYIACRTNKRVSGAANGCQVKVHPFRIVEVRFSPDGALSCWIERRISDLKSPGFVKGNDGPADLGGKNIDVRSLFRTR